MGKPNPDASQDSSSISTEIDIDKAIRGNQCAKEYYLLENCMLEYERSWKQCQKAVAALKLCNDSMRGRTTSDKS